MSRKSTATALRRSVNRLNKLHEQMDEARESYSNAIQARYGVTLDDASECDYDILIEFAYYGGCSLNLAKLDEEMKEYELEVTKVIEE